MIKYTKLFFTSSILLTSITQGYAQETTEQTEIKTEDLTSEYIHFDESPATEKTFLTVEELQLALKRTSENPVSKLEKVPFYDPQNLTGFCFGRSLTAQLEARQLGLHPDSIKNLFIVGDLKQRGAENTEWRFHVTTVAMGPDNTWYALDPIFGLMTQAQWIEATRKIWDTWYLDDETKDAPQSKLYLVNRHAVLPNIVDFKPPEQETGELLVDLSFDPQDRAGFAVREDMGNNIYELDDSAMEEFFIAAVEENPDEQFDFLELKTNFGLTIGYNDYFVDLFKYMNDPSSFTVEAPVTMSLGFHTFSAFKPVNKLSNVSKHAFPRSPIPFNKYSLTNRPHCDSHFVYLYASSDSVVDSAD